MTLFSNGKLRPLSPCWTGLRTAFFLTAIVATTVGAAGAAFVPNFSFESPAVANVSPYASPVIDNWQKEGGQFSTGEFYNTPDVSPQVDNANGNQLGFIFAVPGTGLFQDLTDVYTVGDTLTLTVAVQGGGSGMPLNTPLLFRLYWRDPSILAGDNRVTLASVTYQNGNASGSISHLTDKSTAPLIVPANAPWAGTPIGIELVATDDPAVTESGYFDVDNVRVVPEPGSAALLLAGLGAVGFRRRSRRS